MLIKKNRNDTPLGKQVAFLEWSRFYEIVRHFSLKYKGDPLFVKPNLDFRSPETGLKALKKMFPEIRVTEDFTRLEITNVCLVEHIKTFHRADECRRMWNFAHQLFNLFFLNNRSVVLITDEGEKVSPETIEYIGSKKTYDFDQMCKGFIIYTSPEMAEYKTIEGESKILTLTESEYETPRCIC